MKPEVSIIVPSYGRSEPLFKLIESMIPLNGNLDFEVLVIDQNTSGLRESNQKRLLQFPFVRFIELEVPNVSLARNAGAEHSKSDILLFLDDDIEPTPEFIRQGLDTLNRYPQIEFLVPLIEEFETKPYVFNCPPSGFLSNYIDEHLQQITEAGSLAIFTRRQSFRKSGGFDVPLFEFAKTAEDQEYFYRLSLLDKKIWLDHLLIVFHNHRASGGCELRTKPRWDTRVKCVRSWFLRRRIHANMSGRLRYSDWIALMRSCFLNKGVILNGNIWKELKLFISSAKKSHQYYAEHRDQYKDMPRVNWLKLEK